MKLICKNPECGFNKHLHCFCSEEIIINKFGQCSNMVIYKSDKEIKNICEEIGKNEKDQC